MSKTTATNLFEERQIRSSWDDATEEWYLSIVDVVAVLTDSVDATAYWRKLKQRLKEEENQSVTNCNALKSWFKKVCNELVTNCNQLKMLPADGILLKGDHDE